MLAFPFSPCKERKRPCGRDWLTSSTNQVVIVGAKWRLAKGRLSMYWGGGSYISEAGHSFSWRISFSTHCLRMSLLAIVSQGKIGLHLARMNGSPLAICRCRNEWVCSSRAKGKDKDNGWLARRITRSFCLFVCLYSPFPISKQMPNAAYRVS